MSSHISLPGGRRERVYVTNWILEMCQIKNQSHVIVFDAKRKWSLPKTIGLFNDEFSFGDSLSSCDHLKLNSWKYPVKSPGRQCEETMMFE